MHAMQDTVGAGFLGLSWLLSEPLPSGHSDLDLSIDWSDAVYMQQRSTNTILELKRLIETTERDTETATPASVIEESARQQHEGETQRTLDLYDDDVVDDGTCPASYGKCAVPYMACDEHKSGSQAQLQHELQAADVQFGPRDSPEQREPEFQQTQQSASEVQHIQQSASEVQHLQQPQSQTTRSMMECDDERSVSPVPYIPWRDFHVVLAEKLWEHACEGEYFVPVKYADPYWIRLDLESGKLAGFQDCEWCITKLLHDIATDTAPCFYQYGEALTCSRCDELIYPGHDYTT